MICAMGDVMLETLKEQDEAPGGAAVFARWSSPEVRDFPHPGVAEPAFVPDPLLIEEEEDDDEVEDDDVFDDEEDDEFDDDLDELDEDDDFLGDDDEFGEEEEDDEI